MRAGTGKGGRRRRSTAVTLAALTVGLATLGSLPVASVAVDSPLDRLTQGLDSALDNLLSADSGLPATSADPALAVGLTEEEREKLRLRELELQQERQLQDPQTEPPMHGTNAHGQGTVSVIDISPSSDRPQGGNPNGSDSGEEIVVGRARGEQQANGTYHGHITIAALFGNEILGVDTNPGETKAGPLDAIQQGLLTPLCNGTANQVCLSVVRADSSTTANGSSNQFSAASGQVGGPAGIGFGAAESRGDISSDGTCQTSVGESRVANVAAGGTAVADVSSSRTESKACKGQAPTQTNSSSVIALGGAGVPLPAPGCATGAPDTVTGIPLVAPVICNGDDTNAAQAGQPYGAREALAVWLLPTGLTALTKATTAGSESRAVAPPAQCADGADNDGDGQIDATDPGCLSGPGGAYNPNDDDETNPATTPLPQCSDTTDNDGDGQVDAADPGCLSGPGGTYNPNDNDETNPPASTTTDDDDNNNTGNDAACADGVDNDGDGRTDRNDPGCLSGPGGTYNPDDDNEADGGRPECSDTGDNDGDGLIDADDPGCLSGPGGTYNPNDDSEGGLGAATLPFTGADVLTFTLAGLLLIAAGLALRRRLDAGGQH